MDRSSLAAWIVHLDDALIAVDKPSGLLAVPGRGEAGRDCASARVQARWPEAQIVHRLDMMTSGLLLFARSLDTQRLMHAAFAQRRVHKRYVACVHGLVAADAGTIALPLIADWPARPRQKVDELAGKPSTTHWRVLSRDEAAGTTRLMLEPLTGRSHQLRVHLQAIGHPILGDPLYASAAVQALAPRLLLHACDLAFAHPLEPQKTVSLHSEPPF